VGTAGRSGQEPEPGGCDDRRAVAGAIAKLGSARGLARQASGHVGRAGSRTARGTSMGPARLAGRCSTRADLGFPARPRGTARCLAGIRSNLGISAPAGRSAASAQLEPARTCFCAAACPGTAGSSAVVGCAGRAGPRMGRARSRGARRVRRTGSTGLGSAAGERPSASPTRRGGTAMGCVAGN
jgi:hypothetical protein